MALFIGSYQYLQKAHFLTFFMFTVTRQIKLPTYGKLTAN